jgi:hypothetical protein
MLRCKPDFRDAILACRSQAAQLPNGKIIPLKKFASMGSALCFPIEAMYFFTVVLCARLRRHNLPVTLRNIFNMSRGVYVYGDDIIVPVSEVDIVMKTLAENFCKVNARKSFWNGKFRESCGMDAYDGECVTPTYLRNVCPHDKGDTSELVSWIASGNLFFSRGYWKTAALLREKVELVLGKLPVILETSPGVGWTNPFSSSYSIDRVNKKLHRPEVLTYVVSPVYYKDELNGWSALLKFFLSSAVSSLRDENLDVSREQREAFRQIKGDIEHLSRSPRSGTFSMKRRRVPPY